MKRKIYLLMSTLLLAGLLAACGKAGNTQTTSAPKESQAKETQAPATENIAQTETKAQESSEDLSVYEKQAEQLVKDFVDGSFETVFNQFTDAMAKQITEAALKQGWESTVNTLGKYIGHVSTLSQSSNDGTSVAVLSEFEGNGVLVTVTYDSENKISGLWMTYQAIEKSDNDLTDADFEEIDITVSADEKHSLAGKLTLPKGIEKPPVVILVHGSGSSDMNETINGNVPFKDIAHGLAAQGIAAIRYDKRYFTYQQEGIDLKEKVGIRDEVLDDVNAAIALAKQDDRLNAEKIFVLGHSLGGCLTPAIASENQDLAGIISMAGSLRPLYEISYDQNMQAVANLGDTLSEDDQKTLEAQLAQLETDMVKLRNLANETTLSDSDTLLGMYVGYWRSLDEYWGTHFIDQVTMPILILQGSADFQVFADKDYPLWESTLTGKDNVTFRLYEGLNHLMMPTQNKKDITEYAVKSNVSTDVIKDIASFINQ